MADQIPAAGAPSRFRLRYDIAVEWWLRGPRRLDVSSTGKRLTPPARLALVGLVLTPVALACDYRLGLGLITKGVVYTPYAENGGLPASYEQVFGVTQALWLLIGVYALSQRRLRAGFRSLTVASLAGFLVLVVAITAALDGIDSYAALALSSTLLPLTAMAGVLLHPEIDDAGLRRLILAFAGAAAVVTAGTLASDLVKGSTGDRFDLLLFGPATDTGLVLAMTLILLPAASLPRWLVAIIAIPLLVGLGLTQTRGALIAFAAGTLLTAVLLPHRRRAAVAAVSAAMVLALAAFLLLSKRSLLLTDQSTNLRRAELARHWQLFLARPTYGYGVAKQSAPFFATAHNTVLGIANAAGIGGALLWLGAWIQPVMSGLWRVLSIQTAVASGVLASAFVGWFTTGTAVLLYTPPTNLLPLLLAVALARTALPGALA